MPPPLGLMIERRGSGTSVISATFIRGGHSAWSMPYCHFSKRGYAEYPPYISRRGIMDFAQVDVCLFMLMEHSNLNLWNFEVQNTHTSRLLIFDEYIFYEMYYLCKDFLFLFIILIRKFFGSQWRTYRMPPIYEIVSREQVELIEQSRKVLYHFVIFVIL